MGSCALHSNAKRRHGFALTESYMYTFTCSRLEHLHSIYTDTCTVMHSSVHIFLCIRTFIQQTPCLPLQRTWTGKSPPHDKAQRRTASTRRALGFILDPHGRPIEAASSTQAKSGTLLEQNKADPITILSGALCQPNLSSSWAQGERRIPWS